MASAAVDHLTELLSKLRLDTNRKSLLKQVNAVLSSVNNSEIEEICENLQLTPLFDCLNADRKEIEIACVALNRMLSSLPPTTLLSQYQSELIRGVNHPDVEVKKLVLKQLARCVEDRMAISLIKNNDLFVIVASLLGHSDMTVAKYAHEVLTNVAKIETGLSLLFTSQVLSRLHQIMAQNDVNKFRVYDVIVTVSKQSELALHKCIEAGLLTQLVADFNSDDLLVQLNCLDMLSELSMSSHGLQYLVDNGVVRKLENMLQQAETSSSIGFLLPGLFKFFGYVGHLYPKEICSRYSAFVDILYKAVDSNDPVLKGVAIQTVGILGSNMDGKFALDKIGDSTMRCINSIGSAVVGSPTELRIKALNAIQSLVSVEESEQTSETNDLVKKWFNHLNPRTMELLWGLCRQPFHDLRLATLEILRAIAKQSWGQQYMNDLPGFIEYLLDRKTETEKQGKEMKYEVIKILAESPTSCETLGNIVVSRLQQYVKDGPFFVRAEAAVAFEGSN